MANSRKKLKQMKSIVKVRQVQLNTEVQTLSSIRHLKLEALKELKHNEKLYIEGVDKLNIERQSQNRSQLGPLESSLDFVKAKWERCMREVRRIEDRERAQIAQVLNAELNLKSVEKLSDKYEQEVIQLAQQQEQKAIDEIALRKFHKN